jgi:hypothetical protein
VVDSKQSKVHSCYSQHLGENKPKRCRCRKKVSLADATREVERGFAQWVVLSQTMVSVKETCSVCANDILKKGCQNCQGTGEVEKSYPSKVHGMDIVLVTAGTEDDDGNLVYKPVKAKKTPRTATIEKAHICRAYVDGDQEEIERIEIYGLMTLAARIDMKIGFEPEDDPKTGTGRNCDWGRTPYARIADERTSIGGIGKRITEGFRIADEDALKGKD